MQAVLRAVKTEWHCSLHRPRQFPGWRRASGGGGGAVAVVAMASKGGGKGKGQGKGGGNKGLVFGSDPDKVLDKGVWKRFKYCAACGLIVVERAKWKDCWDDIKFCSDRCRNDAKRAKKQAPADAGQNM